MSVPPSEAGSSAYWGARSRTWISLRKPPCHTTFAENGVPL